MVAGGAVRTRCPTLGLAEHSREFTLGFGNVALVGDPEAMSILPARGCTLCVFGGGWRTCTPPPCRFLALNQVPLNWEVDQVLLSHIVPWVSLGLLLPPSAACPMPLSGS